MAIRNVLIFFLVVVLMFFVSGCRGKDDYVEIPPAPDPYRDLSRGQWAFWYVDSVEIPGPVIARQPFEITFNIYAPSGPSITYPYFWSQGLWTRGTSNLIAVCGTSDPDHPFMAFVSGNLLPIFSGEQRITLKIDGSDMPGFFFTMEIMNYGTTAPSIVKLQQLYTRLSPICSHTVISCIPMNGRFIRY